MDFLETIIAYKEEELESLKRRRPLADLKLMARDAEPPRPFLKNLTAARPTRIIAEIKKASPSAGIIRPDFSPTRLRKSMKRVGRRPSPC